MQRPVTTEPPPPRAWTRNAPLALILAGGLAAGLGLARPADPDPDPAADGTDLTEADGGEARTDSYRRGTREPGRRAGVEPARPADPAAGGQADQGQEAEAAITIEDFAFDGPTTAVAGSSLRVTNRDGTPHTLTFRNSEADTGTVDDDTTVTLTAPSVPGTYAYFCRIHPSMEGEIELTG